MKFASFFLIALFFNADLSTGAIDKCYTNGFTWTVDGDCIEVVFRLMNWYDARNYCAARGGDLVEIRTQEIQDSLVEHLTVNHSANGLWIGATDTDKEGIWEWNHDDRRMHFTNWASDQGPHDHGFLFGGALEDCGMIRVDDNFKWHDGPCEGVISTLHYDFICQYKIKTMTTQSPSSTEPSIGVVVQG